MFRNPHTFSTTLILFGEKLEGKGSLAHGAVLSLLVIDLEQNPNMKQGKNRFFLLLAKVIFLTLRKLNYAFVFTNSSVLLFFLLLLLFKKDRLRLRRVWKPVCFSTERMLEKIQSCAILKK